MQWFNICPSWEAERCFEYSQLHYSSCIRGTSWFNGIFWTSSHIYQCIAIQLYIMIIELMWAVLFYCLVYQLQHNTVYIRGCLKLRQVQRRGREQWYQLRKSVFVRDNTYYVPGRLLTEVGCYEHSVSMLDSLSKKVQCLLELSLNLSHCETATNVSQSRVSTWKKARISLDNLDLIF